MEAAAREMAEAGDVGGQPHRHSVPTRTRTGETQGEGQVKDDE